MTDIPAEIAGTEGDTRYLVIAHKDNLVLGIRPILMGSQKKNTSRLVIGIRLRAVTLGDYDVENMPPNVVKQLGDKHRSDVMSVFSKFKLEQKSATHSSVSLGDNIPFSLPPQGDNTDPYAYLKEVWELLSNNKDLERVLRNIVDSVYGVLNALISLGAPGVVSHVSKPDAQKWVIKALQDEIDRSIDGAMGAAEDPYSTSKASSVQQSKPARAKKPTFPTMTSEDWDKGLKELWENRPY